jgi:uncharacterized repeat protein (TIGR01451 family)
MGSSVATASVTCSRPVIAVSKVADLPTPSLGDTVVYTIYYNNTGSATAGSVWINDTLPSGVTFVSASPSPDSIAGSSLSWHFTGVVPGSHALTVTVTVDSDAAGTLTNWAFVDYSSAYSQKLEQSSDSAVIVIPEMQHAILAVVGTIIIGMAFMKKRRDSDGTDI